MSQEFKLRCVICMGFLSKGGESGALECNSCQATYTLEGAKLFNDTTEPIDPPPRESEGFYVGPV